MRARQAAAPPDARAQVVASGLGYVDFAVAAPALFGLMFRKSWTRSPGAEMSEAGAAAFAVLTEGVARLNGRPAFHDDAGIVAVLGCWSVVHGFAELLLAGQLDPIHGMPAMDREAVLRRIIERSLG
jgi:hypothetical protein